MLYYIRLQIEKMFIQYYECIKNKTKLYTTQIKHTIGKVSLTNNFRPYFKPKVYVPNKCHLITAENKKCIFFYKQ